MAEIKLNIGPEMFTDVFAKVWEAQTRYVINYGGTGSSKSYSQAQCEVLRSLQNPGMLTLCMRKVGEQLKDNVIPNVLARAKEFLEPYHNQLMSYNKNDREITFSNGSTIKFRGMDNPEKLKSIEGVRRIWCEEASDFTQDDLLEIGRRVRGSEGVQISFTLNPIGTDLPVKRLYIDTDRDNVSIIHSTWKDNPYLGATYYQDELERYKLLNDGGYQWQVYVEGEWGSYRSGMEFYSSFARLRHVTDTPYVPGIPVMVSFDQNVVPYCTATLYQVVKLDNGHYQVRQFDEVTLSNPRNRTEEVCREIVTRYGHQMDVLYYYGDATGRRRDTRNIVNDYDIVERELKQYIRSNSARVPASNPPVSKRRDFINRIFSGFYPIDIVIDPRCKESIADFETVKEAPDRTKLKERRKDPKTGVTAEVGGHTSDTFDYFICENFRNYFYK